MCIRDSLSFISPENVLQNKDKFMFQKFLEDYEIELKVKTLEQFLGSMVLQINRKLDACADAADAKGDTEAAAAIRAERVPVDSIIDQYQGFIKKNKKEVNSTYIEEAFKDFVFRRGKQLDDDFHAQNEFQTTIRGLKVRGICSTTAEASARAKKLVRSDPIHNILVGEVGKWLPWDPSPNAIQDQEYAEDQLNQLMQSYKKNEESVDNFYKENNLKRPSKTVFGSATDNGATESAVAKAGEKAENSIDASNSLSAGEKAMFEAVGDLALERKIAAAAAKKE
jgi:hypothetical protein